MKEKKNYVFEDRKVIVGLDKVGYKIEEIISGYVNVDRKFESINLSYNLNFIKDIKYLVDVFYNKGNFFNINFGN